MINATKIKKDFPIFERTIGGKPIIYLDSAATSLKPRPVLSAMEKYYTRYTANVFRGIYTLSEEATEAFEGAREKVAAFIGAKNREIVFTRNTSESINLVAYSWGQAQLSRGDEVVVTIMEHHSNFVPWQQLAKEKGLGFRVWGVEKDGTLDLKKLNTLITRKTKLLAIAAVSNVLGTINPIQDIVRLMKRRNPDCLVLVDAAQAVPHMPVDVSEWGADFVAFSSHKMLGPTGVGVLWGGLELLEAMQPFLYGGEMIREVRVERTVFKDVPHKFEAGTPDIAGVIGLGAAVDYLEKLGMSAVRAHEQKITAYAMQKLGGLPGITIHGPKSARERGGVIAFTVSGVHAHDVAQLLNEDNVCVRAGNHCAMPLHLSLGIAATTRASFSVYTAKADIDALVKGLERVKKVFT